METELSCRSQGAVFYVLLLTVIPSAYAEDSDARQFWAFQKLARPPVPEVLGPARTPVDKFILAKLEAVDLGFSSDADRGTLLRRAQLDLVGLPPSPDEIDSHLSDASPDAYERLLDRLIDSPHFGERWGQHWLDAAGFVTDRKSRWRYRDYVIRAFSHDKPYDRFLVEQLAGDELVDWRSEETLSPKTRELLVATGLLRSARDDTGNVMTDIPSYHYGILFNTLEILGTSVLGLTLQCARCHSHKYDPIPQRDFYRLMALFTPAYNSKNWLRNGDRKLPEGIDGLYDVGPPPKTHLLTRGNINAPGLEVRAGFLRALSESNAEALVPDVTPGVKGRTSGRRLAFARWLTEPDTSASALVARVMVNRIWHNLFGRGIVTTLGNLGHSGARPTHPDLIDYLASEFVRGGWRVKPLIKLVMLSTVYRQASTAKESTGQTPSADPDNLLLSRMPLRRLQSEVLRDAILTASGKMDRTMGGLAVPIENRPDGVTVVSTKGDLPTPTSQWRRSLYLATQRVDGTGQPTITFLTVFDQPVFNTNCTKRRSSTVVLQSLAMLNDRFVLEHAALFADRVAREAGSIARRRIELAFRVALARSPTEEEVAWSEQFLIDQEDAYKQAAPAPETPGRRALASLCHALFNLNNFLYVE